MLTYWLSSSLAHLLHPVGYRAHVTQAAMKSLPVVKDFDVIKHIPLYILYCSILPPIKILFFQTGKETFHRTAPIGISRFAHAAHDLVLCQHGLITVAAVLASSVTVKDRGLIFLFPVKRIS